MKRKLFIKKIALIALVLSAFIAACNDEKKESEESKEKKQTFICPMHPQIIKKEMGTCPVCGMDLVPVEDNSNDKALIIDERRQTLANITTLFIGSNNLSETKQLNGRLVINPEQSSYISSRISGRIVQLYIKEIGIKVKKGMPIYQLYSEELATLQQEYLMAAAQEKQFPGDQVEQQILQSAKQKLLLYGQSESQLQKLVKTQKKDPLVIFYAAVSGVVAELSVTEGQYIAEGSPVVRLEGYNSLWVEADVYPNETKAIKAGQKVKVVIPGWEDQPQQMNISFISPVFQSGTQLTQIRGSIPNPDHQWQPGLQANIFIQSENKSHVLTLPVDAVIRDGKGMYVWIKRAKDKFEPRLVKTGQENYDQVEITAGLNNGDQVVITGAYLLYSEYILKRGKNPVESIHLL